MQNVNVYTKIIIQTYCNIIKIIACIIFFIRILINIIKYYKQFFNDYKINVILYYIIKNTQFKMYV